ncbi:MAG: antibiotic biosynthesis monooxygenase [Lewinellaceae bacterium]|nr:antibiotic biosynthesis monooxygenase [Lewinellaceae bacterium]
MLAKITGAPYFAVIFTSKRPLNQEDGYDEMADRMVALSATQPGFLGIESWRNAEGYGVTISYWRDLEAIQQWKKHPEHLPAQARGRKEWYEQYYLRVCKVDYDYAFPSIANDSISLAE